jgi:hypothetical protein
MRYDDRDRESSNIEDRRSQGGGGFPFPGGGGRRVGIPIPIGGRGGMSITTLLIIGGIMLLLGINPLDVLRQGGGFEIPQFPDVQQQDRSAGRNAPSIPGLPGEKGPASKADDEMRRFVARVLADTEDVWRDVFQKLGRTYQEPQLVLFRGQTRSACGIGQAEMGPFYCPLDRKIYIDLAFYEELRRRFQAPGDFAQAYVIAHEVGHHVQTLLGISEKVQAEKQRNPSRANEIQVRMELQADCLAGVWGSVNDQVKKRLEPGDIEEALNAASAIGDDTIQRRTTGRVAPESFTHGTAEQRVAWFKRGFQSGQISSCNTFSATL